MKAEEGTLQANEGIIAASCQCELLHTHTHTHTHTEGATISGITGAMQRNKVGVKQSGKRLALHALTPCCGVVCSLS